MSGKCPGMQEPWKNCEHSSVSFCFDIHEGFDGCVIIYAIPDCACLSFELYDYDCCSKVLEFCTVPDLESPECKRLETDCNEKLTLAPGRYRMVLEDCDGNPLIPDPDEIKVRVHHRPL